MVIVVDMVFLLSTCLTSLITCSTSKLVVDDTVDGEKNKEKKTREGADK